MLEMMMTKKPKGQGSVGADGLITQVGVGNPARYVSMHYIDGYLYAFGGQTQAGGTNAQLWRMNIATLTWERRADMLSQSQRWAATVLNGKIYATYGAAQYSVYDPVANTWSTVFTGSNFSTQFSELVSWNGDIFQICGNDNGNASSAIKKLNVAAGSWDQVGTIPVALRIISACVVGDEIIIVGGQNGASALVNTVYAYNLATNVARTLSPIMAAGVADPLYFSRTVEWKGKAITIGGSAGGSSIRSAVLATDPAGTTVKAFDMSTLRRMFGAAAVPNDGIYIYSGVTVSAVDTTMYKLT